MRRTHALAQLIALVFLILSINAFSASTVQANDGPAALLEDAIEALALNEQKLAIRLFEQVANEYPGTAEAARAVAELRRLGAPPSDQTTEAAPDYPARQPPGFKQVRMDDLRRQFLESVGDRVFFAENSSSIGGRARAMIENQARWLARHPEILVLVIGRADDGGAPDIAGPLSRQRAEAVRDRLVAAGIKPERITVDARGDTDKVALCTTFMCRAQNRSVETLLRSASEAKNTSVLEPRQRAPGQQGATTVRNETVRDSTSGEPGGIDLIGRP